MEIIFDELFAIHPWMPAIYIIILSNGLLSPAIYCAKRKLPYSINIIYHDAHAGRPCAIYSICSYFALVICTIVIFIHIFL